MKFVDEYRDSRIGRKLIESIRQSSRHPVRFMEFCGSHTVAIFKHGLRQLLPPTIKMLSGPGCPVCVTSVRDIDRVIALAGLPGVTVATFGDLIRVPGTESSLQQSRAEGNDIRVVYSALESLDIARQHPEKKVVLVGIGFETTAPTIAASVLQAREEDLKNYSVLALHKLTPPATKAILQAGETRLDGILCPGHVSVITGSNPFRFIVEEYGIGCAVSGFEPLDILLAIDALVKQAESRKPGIEIIYSRAVRPEGNRHAQAMMRQVFEVCAADWRGMGIVPESGLRLRDEFARFNAERAFEIPEVESRERVGCICGEVLRGVKAPPDCKLFGKGCTPTYPVGPCMVSSEGTCSAYYLYGDSHG